MKKLIAVILLSLSLLTAKAIENFWDTNALIVSPSLDARMLIQEHFDFKARIAYRFEEKWNPYIAYEIFSWAELKAYTVGIQYSITNQKVMLLGMHRPMSFLIGYETGMIHNQGQKVWINAITGEVEVWTRHGFAITYLGEYMTRPELSDSKPWAIYSGRVGFKFIM